MFSRLIFSLVLLTAVLGCAPEEEPKDKTEEDPCTVLVDGPWLLYGTSIGHDMFGTLVFDEESCTFALSDWNMAMDIATGGTIDGDTVTFVGDGADRDWAQCSGPVLSETSAKAQCDDGATITMDYDG